MDIFSFVTLFGGLAFFLFGMKVLSDSLKKTAGGKLESLLKKATDNPIKGLGIGALITVAIQSSSAMTVMLVGFVNSGIMESYSDPISERRLRPGSSRFQVSTAATYSSLRS